MNGGRSPVQAQAQAEVVPDPPARTDGATSAPDASAPRPATPDLSIAQHHHTSWRRADGAPTMVADITQGRDGFLWLGGMQGLFRFDGLAFERISPTDADNVDPVTAVLAGRNGDLWAWFLERGRLGVYRSGRLHFVPTPEITEEINQLLETPDGAIWAGGGRVGAPLYRYHQGRWETHHPTAGLPPASFINMVATADGALWIAYPTYTVRRAPEGGRFQAVGDLRSTAGRVALDASGRVWHFDQGAARPISGPGGRPVDPLPDERLPADDASRSAIPVFDSAGAPWEATRSGGVARVGLDPAGRPRLDRFGVEQGLSADATLSVYVDRQGAVWVGTTGGLDRFRRAPIVPERALTRVAAYGDHLLAARNGDVYVAETDAVWRVRAGGAPERVVTGSGDPQGLCEGPGGTIWILSAQGIRRLRPDGTVTTWPRPPREVSLYGCRIDARGVAELAAGPAGLFRWNGSGWAPVPAPGGGPLRVGVFATDSAGRGWTAPDRKGLAVTGPDGWRTVLREDQIRTRNVLTLLPTDRGVLYAGWEGGAMYLTAERRVVGPIAALQRATGLAQTPNGDVWGFSGDGLVRIPSSEFDKVLSRPGYRPAVTWFGDLDGLPERSADQSSRALVLGGDGRLWLSTITGVAWMDPNALGSNPVAPSLKVTRLEAGGVRWRDPANVALKAGTDNLVVSFAALSPGAPERIDVRYRLEGVDHDWVRAGDRRQAFYTNLDPGAYRFQVIAANADGVWNREGASLDLTIAPTFLQSIWFKFLIALGLLGLAWAAYLLRMRAVTAGLHERFQVRIAERERIARELHDTLLQGVQGLVLRFQAVASRLPPDDDARASVDETLERADALMAEGRARLRDLRRDAADIDLARAIADAAAEIDPVDGRGLQLTVEGEARPLQAETADELLRIAEEAFRNAIHHGQAGRLDVLLVYGRRELRMAVRDDGKGMDPQQLQQGGPEGHFGLVGMRERAERVGGRFEVFSRLGQGVEVSVRVPGRRAYRDASAPVPARLLRWWDRLRGRPET